MTDSPKPCGMCGSNTTTRAYFPAQFAWFCVGSDGATCYERKTRRETTEANQ